MSLWLIGAGAMAQDYAKVLSHLGQEYLVVGRNAASAERFAEVTGVAVRQGGVTSALKECCAPEQAIVAVGIDKLSSVATELIEAGVRSILMEKPGGLNYKEICRLQQKASEYDAEVFIAYNRRYYASTQAAREMIFADGGAVSCVFEFTEWPQVIMSMEMSDDIKDRWFLANSTHVVDLAFHLCGFPKDWRAWRSGKLEWHNSGARFCGSGITDLGVLFSYHADWEAPGRWGLEVLTRKRRFIFRPMERLQIVKLGSVLVDLVDLNDNLDKEFKPGLYAQTKDFLARDNRWICTIDQQVRHCAVYDEMAGY